MHLALKYGHMEIAHLLLLQPNIEANCANVSFSKFLRRFTFSYLVTFLFAKIYGIEFCYLITLH